MILPSFAIIYAVSRFLNGFLEITWVSNAFRGIKIAVGILIVDAAIKMLKKMKQKPMQISIVICSVLMMFLINVFAVNISSMILMLAAAFIGIIVFVIKNNMEKRREEK